MKLSCNTSIIFLRRFDITLLPSVVRHSNDRIVLTTAQQQQQKSLLDVEPLLQESNLVNQGSHT
jgi:hypothetical protein